jgi:hypothetical protein
MKISEPSTEMVHRKRKPYDTGRTEGRGDSILEVHEERRQGVLSGLSFNFETYGYS